MQVERRRAKAGAATIAYQVAGSGAPLVLLHGLSGSGRWWRWNIDTLARRFQVHLTALAGFGGNARGQQFQRREASAVLRGWASQRALAQARWIGHSMGGYILAELAADAPEHVGQLVLVNAA